MKSLFEDKEACLREELGQERDTLAREAALLRQRLEQAEAGRAAAEVRDARPCRVRHRWRVDRPAVLRVRTVG